MDLGSPYEPGAGILSTSFRTVNTVVPNVLRRSEFWFFLLIHIAVCVLYRLGYIAAEGTHLDSDSVLYISNDNMRIITTLTTFFQVFYSHECYTRYQELFMLTRQLLVQLHRFTFLQRVHLHKPELRQHIRLALRFVLASVMMFFYEVNDQVSDEEWDELVSQGLIMEDEKEFLKQFGTKEKHLILLHWSGDVTRLGFSSSGAPANNLKEMLDCHLNVLTLQQQLIDTLNLPVPFQYFHLLNMMIAVNLFMWAYSMGCSNSASAPVIFFFAELIFIGLLELSMELSDPFGEDEVDFPVNQWVTHFVKSALVLCEYDYTQPARKWEDTLKRETPLKLKDDGLDVYIDKTALQKRASREASRTEAARYATAWASRGDGQGQYVPMTTA
mmetsp:Transcript_46599/g.120646  ORF Transcript_46599/g.120646 Transcript_46599/m.120646 type:complete len:386 (-) Transcript_46599:96-1253(-)